jgi:hypothetical protein
MFDKRDSRRAEARENLATTWQWALNTAAFKGLTVFCKEIEDRT